MSTFARFPPRLQQAIVSRLGWTALRPVQKLAGGAILDGCNVVVLAPTAGGKTEAAIFPVLANLVERPPEGLAAIYVAPIKALLNNLEGRLAVYTEMVGLQRFVWHGDVGPAARKRFLAEPAELLMTTPESLEVMLLSPRVPAPSLFAGLRFLVVDEVHALAGTDRGAHLASVAERLLRFTPNDVQRIGLSATVGNPEAILAWLGGTSKRPGVVVDPPKPPAQRRVSVELWPETATLAAEAARRGAGKKSLFFCDSRALTEAVAERMRGRGTKIFVHHSSVSLEERQRAEETFHEGGSAAIACTSTLELGIDVGDLDLVFQANAPTTVSSFLQRMGRTGRRQGQTANTTFFCDNAESVLQALALVELARGDWVEPVPPQRRCWPVLVHQLMALTLQFGGVSAEQAWEQLSRVPDFSGIERRELDEVIAHMLREDYLFEAGGLLSIGDRAEKVYGRRNFLELYAVFSSPVHYQVATASGRDIGTLEQAFVDTLVEEMTSFLLAGRAWTVEHISHRRRQVRVQPAPRGKKPSWGGITPQLLGFEVCRRVRDLLADDADLTYLHPSAVPVLEDYRADLGPVLHRPAPHLRLDDGAARWWTFAGGRINHTLKHALGCVTSWRIVAANFHLRLEGEGLTLRHLREAVGRISAPAFWDDEASWARILSGLPDYRLSKFQQVLPARFTREMVGRYLLDGAGAQRVLGEM